MSLKRLIALLAVIIVLACLGAGWFLIARKAPAAATAPGAKTIAAHVYKNEKENIDHVRIKMFYAVPKNKAATIDPAWSKELSSALDKTIQFHSLQFRGASELAYDIYPQPVILEHEDVFYDTTSTNDGNPHALVGVGEEIQSRVFDKSGGLYDAAFSAAKPGEYTVIGILYAGVGASGGMIYNTSLSTISEIAKETGLPSSIIYIVNVSSASGFFILNHDYLTKSTLADAGPTVLYHEFAHTIGLPDYFDANNAPFSNDIMGEGRHKPIEDTYIDQDFLNDMGVL